MALRVSAGTERWGKDRPNMKEISFMSEHTAEYAVVPDLSATLSGRYSRIIPVYFWSTREGSRVGCESGSDRPFRVVAAFARRPKVAHAGSESIVVKVNEILFSTAHLGTYFGVPILAGVPMINDLHDFFVGASCSWFHITSQSELNVDREFRLSLEGEVQNGSLPTGIAGPLSKTEIVEVVESQCRELDWLSVLDAMRHLKSAGRTRHPIFSCGYRPFFMVITDDNEPLIR